jgi:hypothetical protein
MNLHRGCANWAGAAELLLGFALKAFSRSRPPRRAAFVNRIGKSFLETSAENQQKVKSEYSNRPKYPISHERHLNPAPTLMSQ